MHAAVDALKPQVAPLPVTILTGFLGSGKTTLINYLLQHHQGERIAIIENEFGAAGIDGALIQAQVNAQANVEVLELSNGCVCCSIRGELTSALQAIIARIDSGELAIERLILETTGLADPAPIIQTFFVDELIRERVVLDAVITLVDAHHILKQLDEHRVAAAQIGFADRIILTKADLVDPVEKAQALSRIHTINAKAQIIETLNGALPKQLWLNIGAFELDEALQLNQGVYQAAANPLTPQAIDPSATPFNFTPFTSNPSEQSWNDDIQSYTWTAGELDLKKIGAFMEHLVETHGNDMLRYKGVLAIEGEPRTLIVQGVHKVVGFDYGAPFKDTRQSLLVIISRYLPSEALKQAFIQTQA